MLQKVIYVVFFFFLPILVFFIITDVFGKLANNKHLIWEEDTFYFHSDKGKD